MLRQSWSFFRRHLSKLPSKRLARSLAVYSLISTLKKSSVRSCGPRVLEPTLHPIVMPS